MKDSVENFINKIGGILHLKDKSLIEQRIAYIKGICRNRFNYWDNRVGSIILNKYIDVLKNYGWTDEQILKDIDNDLKSKTLECRSWAQWKNLVEQWTEDVHKWIEKRNEELKTFTIAELEKFTIEIIERMEVILPALNYIGAIFKDFDSGLLEEKLAEAVIHYLKSIIDFNGSEGQSKPYIMKSYWKCGLGRLFNPIEDDLTFFLENSAINIYKDWLEEFEVFEIGFLNPKDASILLSNFIERKNSKTNSI